MKYVLSCLALFLYLAEGKNINDEVGIQRRPLFKRETGIVEPEPLYLEPKARDSKEHPLFFKESMLTADKRDAGQIEAGEVFWTSDEKKVPADVKDECREMKPKSDEDNPCWCFQYWAEDQSDIDYFCCSNCYTPPRACFPPTARVLTPRGDEVRMSELKTGTPVMAVDEDGKLVESEILGFMDRKPQAKALYLTFVTSSGKTLTMTPTHLVFSSKEFFMEPEPVFANEVHVGDYIFDTTTNATVTASEVVEIRTRMERGGYVPLTKEGTMIVDGHYVSCYATVGHKAAHSFLKLARLFPQLISLRLSSKEGCEGPLEDPAAEEGCGESLYTIIGKLLSKTFVASFFEEGSAPKVPMMSSLIGVSIDSVSHFARTW